MALVDIKRLWMVGLGALAGMLSVALFVLFLPKVRVPEGTESRPAELYFLRHAQTVANQTQVWNPETESAFTAKGIEQVEALTDVLMHYSFDAVVVSPKWRTQHTVLPFLKATGLTAEIWPELNECCWQDDKRAPVSTPLPTFGPPIVPADVERLRPRDSQSALEWNEVTFGDGMHRVRAAAKLLRSRFAGSGKSVLVVGHSEAGQRLVQLLRGRDPEETLHLDHAQIRHLTEQSDGNFEFVPKPSGAGVRPAGSTAP